MSWSGEAAGAIGVRGSGGFGGPGAVFAFAIGVDGELFSSGFDVVGRPLRPSRSWDEVIVSHKRAGRSDCLAVLGDLM